MAHQLLIGKGMITLNLKRIFLALTLLPLFAGDAANLLI
ncbi:Uncharacterised protein [Escherichia coli]|nr:Uncharacterised protein [Escherichia coli]